MSTIDLRNKIDSILGNSMRVLLPSYWWKRAFNVTADAIDTIETDTQEKIGEVQQQVDKLAEKMTEKRVLYANNPQDHKEENLAMINTLWVEYLVGRGHDPVYLVTEDGAWLSPNFTVQGNSIYFYNVPRKNTTGTTKQKLYTYHIYNKAGGEVVIEISDSFEHYVNQSSQNAVQSSAVYTAMQAKQDKLVSGSNIKTINGMSIIGSGDITIQGGGGSDVTVDSALSTTSTNPLQNKVVTAELNKINNTIKNGAGAISINVDTTAGTWSQARDSVTQDKYLHESDYKGYELRINGVKRGFIGGIENTSHNGIPSSYIRWTEIIPQQDLFSKSWINITFENYILKLGNDGKTKGFTKYVTKITNNEISNSGVDESLRFDFAEYDLISGEENLITNRTRNYTIPKELLNNVETLVALARSSSSLLTKSSIKTLNGVSLVGDGNLQLGDGQTIVYDDSQVQTRLTSLETTSDDIYDEIDAIWDEVDGILDDMSLDYKDFSNALDDLTDETNELIARVDDMEAGNKMMDSFLSQGFYTMPLRKIFAIPLYPGFVITDFTTSSLALIIEEGGTQNVYKEDLPYVVQKKIIGNNAAFNDETISFQSANYAKLLALESRLSALEGNQTT